jgi:hypothetical protein
MKKNFELMMILIVAVVAFVGIVIMASGITLQSSSVEKNTISGEAAARPAPGKKTTTTSFTTTTTLKRCTEGWKCYDNGTKAYQNYMCNWYNLTTCPNGCLNGACVTKTYVPFTVAVGEDSPSSDVILATNVIYELKKRDMVPKSFSSIYLFNEINGLALDNKVTLAIYNDTAVIIVGINSPASHVVFATELSNVLTSMGTNVKMILSSEVRSRDLHYLFI